MSIVLYFGIMMRIFSEKTLTTDDFDNLGGNLYFEDQFGTTDPDYHQFNERFLLVYDSAYEVSV